MLSDLSATSKMMDSENLEGHICYPVSFLWKKNTSWTHSFKGPICKYGLLNAVLFPNSGL